MANIIAPVHVLDPFQPVASTGFQSLWPTLRDLLFDIKGQASTGNRVPANVSGVQPPAFVTDNGAKAYSKNRGTAHDAIDKYSQALSELAVISLGGLQFDEKSSGADQITQALLTAWDKPASKYMNNLVSDGDQATQALLDRLKEFDTAVATNGYTPVTPVT